MELVQVKAYKYSELSDNSQNKVKSWLDEDPFYYEDNDGNSSYEYFSEKDADMQDDHCEINKYLFSKCGKPIHHLIEESEVVDG